MIARHLYHNLLDWCDRNRQQLVYVALVVTLVAVLAWLVGSVTPEARGDIESTFAAPPHPTAGTVVVGSAVAVPDSQPALVESGAAYSPPERIVPQIQVTPTIPPTTIPTGLNGLPFAPDGLDRCDEMQFYRVQAGLIEHFDGVGFRESSCRNDVSSWCCHGYFQLYVSLHVKDHRLGPRYRACGISSKWDVLGTDPIVKQRNACGALAVYEVSGGSAWDVW